MTWAACANRIEKGLTRLEGVTQANVNFAMERATVSYDPSKVDVGKMEESVKKLGYGTSKTCWICSSPAAQGVTLTYRGMQAIRGKHIRVLFPYLYCQGGRNPVLLVRLGYVPADADKKERVRTLFQANPYLSDRNWSDFTLQH